MRFNADVLGQFLRKIYDGFDTAHEIEPTMWREILRVINEGTVEGLSQAAVPPTHDRMFYQSLRHSNEVFAAFKTHTMGREMAAKLLDASGNLKPFDKWVRDVSSISTHQVGSWLRTEYDTAVIRAHAAADWREFERNKDIMPNLRWMPTTSPDPETSHAAYWKMKLTLPVDHPFWDEHHPGDRWNCKCSLEATDAPATPVPDGSAVDLPQRGLENNPGKDGHTFSDNHPYFPSDCNHCFAYKKGGFTNRLKVLFLNREKDCNNCPFINGCLYGFTKEDVRQIKKDARKTVQGSMIGNPEFEHKIKVSRNSIDEWTNQPHIHKAEKNRMILYIDEVVKKAKYLGPGDDKEDANITIHLFETSIQSDKTWIIVKEYPDGNIILYSISDSANILKSLRK